MSLLVFLQKARSDMASKDVVVYKTFQEFYPFYLKEHIEPTNRTLHFTGTSLVFCILMYTVATGFANLGRNIVLCLLVGYGFAWVGHFFFEKNKPATFKYPFMSFAGDWVMWSDIIRGRQPLHPKVK
eukprot:TRINITY_DN17354_c0_g1_i1.p3 TRINITY_DN17354_c0_g1~~TRINITY_DN17354_c0_g1_i1.p3  ORF type:complete len:127 (-),score=15.21 TRINITY_DN17354_c0_g1_i1:219-599(-)